MKIWVVELMIKGHWRAQGGSYSTRQTDAEISLSRAKIRNPDQQFRIAVYERKP